MISKFEKYVIQNISLEREYEIFVKLVFGKDYFPPTPFSCASWPYRSPFHKMLARDTLWDKNPALCLYVLKKLLTEGYDPNAWDNGSTAMYHATTLLIPLPLKRTVMRLMFMYGGNPFLGKYSPLKWATEYYVTPVIEMIDEAFNRPKKPITTRRDNVPSNKIVRIEYFSNKKYLITKFTFANSAVIYSCMKSINSLKPRQKIKLQILFGQIFNDPNGNESNVVESLNDMVNRKNNIIELIYTINNDKTSYIGFKVFEVKYYPDLPQYYTLHSHYAGMIEAYRGSGIMFYIIERPVTSLHEIFTEIAPQKKAIKSGSLMTADGLRLIQDTDLLDKKSDCTYYPKFKNPDLKKLVEKISYDVTESKVHSDDTMLCYITVQDPLQVKDNKAETRDDILTRFFYEDIQGGHSRNKETPFACEISKEFIQKNTKSHLTTGIDFPQEIKRFTPHFKQFLSGVIPTLFQQARKNSPDEKREKPGVGKILSKL